MAVKEERQCYQLIPERVLTSHILQGRDKLRSTQLPGEAVLPLDSAY